MAGRRSKKFISIGRKIITDVTFFMFLFVAAFSMYIYSSMKENAMVRYEQQALINGKAAGTNIDHYVGSMITATKSVYINHAMMEFLKKPHTQADLEANEAQIVEYFKSVYYASSVATQIYLAVPEKNRSFLYGPRYLKFSMAEIAESVHIPEMKDYREIYIEPTHVKTDFGHDIPEMERYPADELVITVWLPISDLPADSKPIAYMAIDLPISFISDNCDMIYTPGEIMYVVDEDGVIIASSDLDAQMKNFSEYYPWYEQNGKENHITRRIRQLLAATRIKSAYFDWSIIKAVPTKNVYALTTGQMASMLVLFVILAGLFLVMIFRGILRYVRSLRQITKYMEQEREDASWDQTGKISDCISYYENDEIRSLMDSFQRLMDSLKEHSIRKYELELAYAKSELRTMQAQINPHFIYNIIQCFATNALKDHNLKQYQMLSSFGQMLHYAMVLEPAVVSVDKEIEYVRRYIALQQMRFERELSFSCEIDAACADFKIPKMSIQPLIENSITHGGLMKKQGGVIQVKVERQGDYVSLLVKDNGKPVKEETVQQISCKIEQIRRKLSSQADTAEEKQTAALSYSVREDENSNHFIGIENVFSRLFLSFGSCELVIEANKIHGTSVSFIVPAKTK